MSLSKFREMMMTGKPGVLQFMGSQTDTTEYCPNCPPTSTRASNAQCLFERNMVLLMGGRKEKHASHPPRGPLDFAAKRFKVKTDINYQVLEKTIILEKIEGRRKGDDRGPDSSMASPTQGMSLSKLQKIVRDREAWHAAVHTVTKSRT